MNRLIRIEYETCYRYTILSTINEEKLVDDNEFINELVEQKCKDLGELRKFVYETFLMINCIARRLRQHMYKIKEVAYERERLIPFSCDLNGLFNKIQTNVMITYLDT